MTDGSVAQNQRTGSRLIADTRSRALTRDLRFHQVTGRDLRDIFDEACERLHYAGSCRRVGRVMRLAAMAEGEWIGGIVLGSPFPNIRSRDDAFGISKYAMNVRRRGLDNAWTRENTEYWNRLQLIVNQARAFVFPQFSGRGYGVRMHRLLESQGRRLWEARYGELAGFDTLCTESSSRLFSDNSWIRVGRTLGHTRDPNRRLSRRVAEGGVEGVRDNAGLSPVPNGTRWWVWVRVLEPIP
jgi:hypothetical protein